MGTPNLILPSGRGSAGGTQCTSRAFVCQPSWVGGEPGNEAFLLTGKEVGKE